MDGCSDEDLVSKFGQTGDERHFDALVQRHIGRVRAMIYTMVLNDADADELTQDVFLRVARSIGRFRGEARFSTWLYRITANTTRSFLARRSRNPVALGESLPEEHDKAPDPAASAANVEQDRRIRAALASLSPRLRAAITLTAIHGMSPREAAAAEGCLPATLYWRVHQARKMLRTELGM